MAQHVEGRVRTFTAGAAIEKGARVKISSGKVVVAGATDTNFVGWMNEPAFADGDLVGVVLRTAEGTVLAVASAAMATVGVDVELTASGRYAAFSAGVKGGVVLTATGAAGDVFELLPNG